MISSVALMGIILYGDLRCEAPGQIALSGTDLIEPQRVWIDSFFHGKDITVRATVPYGRDLALRILGAREDLKLMKKGRVGGLWMGVEEVTFESIPKVILIWTSNHLSAMGEDQNWKGINLDYASLLSGSLPGKTREEEEFLIQELIKLKKHDNLYYTYEGLIQTKPLEKGLTSQAEAILRLPAKIYPGVYTLELIAFQDGRGTLLRSYPIEVQLSGVQAILSHLAAQRGLLYGVLAVTIATLSGLLMGIFLSPKGDR